MTSTCRRFEMGEILEAYFPNSKIKFSQIFVENQPVDHRDLVFKVWYIYSTCLSYQIKSVPKIFGNLLTQMTNKPRKNITS